VNWFASGSTTPIAGSAAGVTISNDCYNVTTLYAPVLGGTIPVPSTVTIGTTYTVYLCELNGTPYPSNDTSNATNCGTAPEGENWIDASFTFTPTAASTAAPTAAPTVTSVSPLAPALPKAGAGLRPTSSGGSVPVEALLLLAAAASAVVGALGWRARVYKKSQGT
jgi:hypothetical protein